MRRIAIIPARGGSKRIPGKNIKLFLGKPIIAYSIEAALKSELFDEVMVSTDDVEIAEIATRFGAKIPFMRSPDNSNDFAGTLDVIKEVVGAYDKTGHHFTYGCCLYPTAPFVTSQKLVAAFEKMAQNNYDSVFPVQRFGYPIQRSLKMGVNDKIEMFYAQYLNSRSQDLESAFHDAGQFYCFDISTVLKKGRLWTDNSGGIEIDENEGQDIDTISDWQLAEMKYKLFNRAEA